MAPSPPQGRGPGYRILDDDELGEGDHALCLSYWESLRGSGIAPSWKQFDLLQVGPQLVPFFTVVDVRTDPMDFIYRFWGTAHVNLKQVDYTGRSVLAHKPDELGQMVFAEYRRVVETRKPIRIVDSFQMESRPLTLTQVIIRLPLSDNGEEVTHIASYCDFRNDLKNWQEYFKEARTPKGSTGSRSPVDGTE